jgi:hypothetical protein
MGFAQNFFKVPKVLDTIMALVRQKMANVRHFSTFEKLRLQAKNKLYEYQS